MIIQIDVIKANIDTGLVTCNLITEASSTKVFISMYDYKKLIKENFFVRDGETLDSANILNTTETYQFNPKK